jgi:hypothetical protein
MTAAVTATGLPSLMTPLDLSKYLGVAARCEPFIDETTDTRS